MQKIVFTHNREILNFLVREKEVYYSDRKMRVWLRCLPPPTQEKLHSIVANSRNAVPAFITQLFQYTEAELKEYAEACEKGESALADVVVKDAVSRGVRLLAREEIKQEVDIKKINDAIIEGILGRKM